MTKSHVYMLINTEENFKQKWRGKRKKIQQAK